jgi:hypothetical protein
MRAMTTIETLDRALALRCRLALDHGKKITVNYETHGGWNRLTGIVTSVRALRRSAFRPSWEITIIEPDKTGPK